ncbi:MAG: H4MPT-linked C1 transfer pathway protein [Methylococcales bacterium]|nr:H4MPT-linked C1 transfer pathway protein [Methylococcales bacterium]
MQQSIIGWDIGGAHIKAALLEPNGCISKVFQTPCPLWKGIEFLNQTVCQLMAEFPGKNFIHVITMTGELVDLFESRDHGVEQIIRAMQENLAGCEIFIYAGIDGFLKPENIQQQHYASIASANWLASASLAAGKLKNGLFIDIGSTTTDILVLANNSVQAIGLTDYHRMVSDELVYTGIIRTAVMAVAQSASFNGQNMGLMAEYFSTMADVHRLTDELNEAHDQTDTPDGAEKTASASAKRLSRMTGYEYSEKNLSLWRQFAHNIKSQQKNRISNACERQLSRNQISNNDSFIGAGIGRFLVKQIADDLGYSYVDFSDLFEAKKNTSVMDIADCAPAASIALLFSSTLCN